LTCLSEDLHLLAEGEHLRLEVGHRLPPKADEVQKRPPSMLSIAATVGLGQDLVGGLDPREGPAVLNSTPP